jgi:hypothetical protein
MSQRAMVAIKAQRRVHQVVEKSFLADAVGAAFSHWPLAPIIL